VVAEIRKAGGTAVANTDSVGEWESANRVAATSARPTTSCRPSVR
jgi:hypothetical protein